MAEDPRERFLQRIDLADTRVRAHSGQFFLCGGETDRLNYLPARSARHLLYHRLVSGQYSDLANKLRLAEDIQDWFRDGTYRDLVTFEEHLAGLSSVILLAVESPGSIAELGAFSVTPAICRRLIVLLDEQHFEADSFIKLGPVARLERDSPRQAIVHDWGPRPSQGRAGPDFSRLEPEIDAILGEIRALMNEQRAEGVFSRSDPGHTMLLICELCSLFGALTQQEIGRFLAQLALDVAPDVLKQYLFLLNKCELLWQKAKGHGRYFHVRDWETHVTFSFRDKQRVDRERLRIDVMSFYQKVIPSRVSVVQSVAGVD